MPTQTVTIDSLTQDWREVRDAHKLDGRDLSPSQVAGLLIEELGSAHAALRVVQVSNDAPNLVYLQRPSTSDWPEVRGLLGRAWLVESGQDLTTVERLILAFELLPVSPALAECTDARTLAGALIEASGGSLERAVEAVGLALYSPVHYAGELGRLPLIREAFFLLDIALWGRTHQEPPEA